MNRQRLLLAGLLLLLAACGQKGALYLPDKNAAVVTSAPAPAPAPATAPSTPAPTPAAPKKSGDKDGDSPAPN